MALSDLMTFGFMEVLQTPIAIADIKSDPCKYKITYGADGRIESSE
jgi:hypothetical protein